MHCVQGTQQTTEHEPHSAACFVRKSSLKQIGDLQSKGPGQTAVGLKWASNSLPWTFIMWDVRTTIVKSLRAE